MLLDLLLEAPIKTVVDRVAPSNKNEQFTPTWIAHFARAVFGESIELDPTSSTIANEAIQAERIYTAEDNALIRSWEAKTLFFNPPYGRGLIKPMIDKFIEELPNIDQAIVLVNSTTTTKAYQSLLGSCDRFLLPSARINFWNTETAPIEGAARRRYQNKPAGGNQYDSTLFYFGDRVEAFEREGLLFGTVARSIGGAQ